MTDDAVGDSAPAAGTPDRDAVDPEGETGDDGAYGGVVGAFPYAFRASESRLFRSYVVVGGLAALIVVVLFGLALVVLLGDTMGAIGGTFTFSRAFFVFIGLLVVAPLVAPVLFAARRARRGSADPRYDAALAATGYLFLASLYVGLVISTPAEQQASVSGTTGAVVGALYALPRIAGLAPPLLCALAIWLVHRRFPRPR